MGLLKSFMKYVIKGMIYGLIFAILGIGFSIFKGWPYLKGAYLFVLGAGILTMFISMILLVGTPSMRKSTFKPPNKSPEAYRGNEGIGPALMGMVMMVIGFWLEALMHK